MGDLSVPFFEAEARPPVGRSAERPKDQSPRVDAHAVSPPTDRLRTCIMR
jgi:hypothetical protein